MSLDPVAHLLLELRGHLDCPVVAQVPAKRPRRFVTVELTGLNEPAPNLLYATFAIQAWAETSQQAAALTHQVRDALRKISETDRNQFTKIKINTAYNWPDPESRQARYQIVADTAAYDQDPARLEA